MAAGPVAAHVGVAVKLDGTPVGMTAEPMSLVSGKTYRPTASTKRCFAPGVALVVLDNAVPVVAANIEDVDFLHGLVTFAAAYSVTGPVTVTGSYVPFVAIGTLKSMSLDIVADALDKSVFADTAKRFARGLGDVTGAWGSWSFLDESVGIGTLEAALAGGVARIVSMEILQDASVLTNGGILARVRAFLSAADTSAEPAGLVETSVSLEGAPVLSPANSSGSWPIAWSIADGASGLRI